MYSNLPRPLADEIARAFALAGYTEVVWFDWNKEDAGIRVIARKPSGEEVARAWVDFEGWVEVE